MRLAGAERVALALSEDGWAVLATGDEAAVGTWTERTGPALAQALSGFEVVCHDAKSVVRATGEALHPVHDTMIAAYLLEPRRRGYPLDELAADAGIGAEGADEPAAIAAALVRELTVRQEEALRREGLEPLYRDIELPVTRVLAAMEARRRAPRRPPPGRDRARACATGPTSCATRSGSWPAASS